MKNKRIFVDVDEVCAHLGNEWVYRYNTKYNDNLQYESVTDWDISKFVKPECGGKMFEFLHETDLYKNVQPIEGALVGVEALRSLDYRVIFATATNMFQAGQKLRWLHEHGFITKLEHGNQSKDYIEVCDKHLLSGHALIDDYPKNLEGFEGRRILFDQGHNRTSTDPSFTRVYHWEEIINQFK